MSLALIRLLGWERELLPLLPLLPPSCRRLVGAALLGPTFPAWHPEAAAREDANTGHVSADSDASSRGDASADESRPRRPRLTELAVTTVAGLGALVHKGTEGRLSF